MGNKSRFYAYIEAMHEEVTGSCFSVTVVFPNGNKLRFIVDCGLYQERDYDELNQKLNINLENISFVLVTHNHVDHTGRLPLLTKKGYTGPFYMSDVTAKIISPALNDSYKVLKERCEFENKPLIYTSANVYDVINQRKPIAFYEKTKINDNVSVTFLKNGHLVGASLILVQISYHDSSKSIRYDDINLLFTGDYKPENVFFSVKKIPKWIRKLPLTIIQEATYGNIDTKDIEYKFEENIISAAKKQKEIFIPAFSQGRFQEMMLYLKKLQDEQLLSKKIPIFLDGNLAAQYTNLFLRKELELRPDVRDFVPENSGFVSDLQRKHILRNSESKIIISTSGMASYGPARTYLPAFITKKNALIHFTGYNAEGTMGRRVLDCKDGEEVMIGGNELTKRADVQNTLEFSGHAKADEMISFLKQFENLKFVLINHGTVEAKKEFSKRVKKEVEPKNVEIINRDYCFCVNAYGFLKKISSKK